MASTDTLSIADVALVAAVQPLLSYVLGAQVRAAYPRVQQWALELCQHPGVGKIMGEGQGRVVIETLITDYNGALSSNTMSI